MATWSIRKSPGCKKWTPHLWHIWGISFWRLTMPLQRHVGKYLLLGKSSVYSLAFSQTPNLHWRLAFHFHANSRKHGLFVIGLSYSILECSINRPHWGALGSAIFILPPCVFTWTLATCQGSHLKRQLGILRTRSQHCFLLADSIRLKLAWFWLHPPISLNN